MIAVWIEPHERFEALEVYRDRLTAEQIDEIDNAPESALIKLGFEINKPATVQIVEEG